jgi:hypothetical protein
MSQIFYYRKSIPCKDILLCSPPDSSLKSRLPSGIPNTSVKSPFIDKKGFQRNGKGKSFPHVN